MSNNAAVTADGGEIGRAQALQAMACHVEPHSDMNPVLLKPPADRTSQLIVHGRVRGTLASANSREARGALMTEHRKRALEGQTVSSRVDLGGRSLINTTSQNNATTNKRPRHVVLTATQKQH